MASNGTGYGIWPQQDMEQQARSIMARLSHDQSFAALWQRLDRAERDRDRMMNALQLVRDSAGNGKVTLTPRLKNIIKRALSRVEPTRAATMAKEQSDG